MSIAEQRAGALMTTWRAQHLSRMTVVGAAVCAITLGTAVTAPATVRTHDEAGGADPLTYLALGDSLSVGFQPGGDPEGQGYVDQLYRRLKELTPALELKNVGCAGETSRSLITGERSPCVYSAGSQLDAAVTFMEAHPGQVALITIDIGANDLFNRCLHWRSGLLDRECTADQRPRLMVRLIHIIDTLQAAAGPAVPVVGMTYYNPLLGFWGMVPGGRKIARTDQRVWRGFNGGLTAAYTASGAKIADVAETFQIDDFKDTVVVPERGRLPANVALACQWTWFCSKRHFGDPHANRIGYRKIAQTFEREIGYL